jgi:hypothetical protein
LMLLKCCQTNLKWSRNAAEMFAQLCFNIGLLLSCWNDV